MTFAILRPVTRRGLFLDLDGTLADSLGVMKAVFVAFHADRALTCTDADFAAANGPPIAEVVSGLRTRYGLAETTEVLLAEYWRRIDSAYERVAAADGAAELLRAAFEH
jgi:beta-phosphoglucomutase-like phosphatase (HAD superfamily)